MSRLAFAALLLALLSAPVQAKGPRLYEERTKHYTLLSDLVPQERRKLGRFLEAMHRTYSKVFKADPIKEVSRPTVRVYKRQEDYAAFCRSLDSNWSGNARGMFFRGPNVLVSYRGRDLPDCYSILSHEGFHQFAWEYFTPEDCRVPPDWIEEGLADYFRSKTIRSGKLRHEVKGYHFRRVKRAIREDWVWTRPQLWNCNPGRIKDPLVFDAFYAHAYAMVAYLAEVSPETLKQVFRLKRKGMNNDDLIDEIFPESKRDKLYRRFLAWVQTQKG